MASPLVAAYLLLCVLLGGSAQGIWSNLALQLGGIALIGWAAVARVEDDSGSSGSAPLYLLTLVAIAVVIVQLVPLPAAAWTGLPGREAIARGFAAIGQPLPPLPVSLTPYPSVMTLFAMIPALAAFIATDKLHPAPRWIALAIVAGVVLGILLGAVQVAGGPNSWAYFYRFTNRDGAVGFFANQNHMATLLLVGIPIAAALLASAKSDRRSAGGRYGIGAALLVLIVVGIFLNGSLAAFLLVVPVLLASASLVPAGLAWRRFALPLAGVAMIAAVGLLVANPIGSGGTQASTSVTGRVSIWLKTTQAIADSFPVGKGLGSFAQVYRQYEDPGEVTGEYVNHAHNDYLELVLELGAAGAILILLFLVWWAVAAVRIWRSPLSTPFARAATIATAAILAHSLVDFPLRTAAISAIFAASVGLMAQHLRSAPAAKAGELRPTRHLKLG